MSLKGREHHKDLRFCLLTAHSPFLVEAFSGSREHFPSSMHQLEDGSFSVPSKRLPTLLLVSGFWLPQPRRITQGEKRKRGMVSGDTGKASRV